MKIAINKSFVFSLFLTSLVCLSFSVQSEEGSDIQSVQAEQEKQVDQESNDSALPDKPKEIFVGAYINDIHEVDLNSHSYPGDIYIWFRWKDTEMRPNKSFEFMNLHDPEAHIQTDLYEEPEVMEADSSLYNAIRHQGAFSSKMPLSKYPFDSQVLQFVIEDAEYGEETAHYVADKEGLTINSDVTLPGYEIGKPRMIIKSKPYPTTFGDLNNPETGSYSRVVFEVPISRPWQFGVFKLILPIILIVICAGLALLIDPTHTEGRIGLVITALLTLVAMQITTGGSLPEVSYLMLLDWVYIFSYSFILLVLAQVVHGSWQDEKIDMVKAARSDKRSLAMAILAFIGSLLFIFMHYLR